MNRRELDNLISVARGFATREMPLQVSDINDPDRMIEILFRFMAIGNAVGIGENNGEMRYAVNGILLSADGRTQELPLGNIVAYFQQPLP